MQNPRSNADFCDGLMFDGDTCIIEPGRPHVNVSPNLQGASMATAHPALIKVTPDDLKALDTILIRLDQQPPEPERRWLKLYKGAIEDAFTAERRGAA
jgi:hypothetical protein